MNYLAILGRQPALGLAELESLHGAAAVQPAGKQAALLTVEREALDFDRLGGCQKLGEVIATLSSTDWHSVETYLSKHAETIFSGATDGKVTIGLSVYDLHTTTQRLLATGLTLKKLVRKTGHAVRLVPNKEIELNTASVLHNKLTEDNGYEFLIVRDGNQTIIARTLIVQDIESYTIRDRDRPKRDAKVGMLPPKLAQIIINLATATNKPAHEFTVLDPFCGTGVVIQEALLMGYSATGSDVDQRMIDYTSVNLDWLAKTYDRVWDVGRGFQLGDATNHRWETSRIVHDDSGDAIDALRVPLKIDAVACETYLGRPFTSMPDGQTLAQTASECNTIIRKFLQNIHDQLEPGTRLCLAVPAWQVRPGQFKHLPLLDSLQDLGYNRISFEHVRNEDLIYYRSDQVVARELLTLVTI